MNINRSKKLYEEAESHIVGGVNSPSRAFKGVSGGTPIFMDKGEGAYLYDVDGNAYIDYIGGYGPIITGHAHPHITRAMTDAVQSGVLYGTPTSLENQFAKKLKAAIPSLEKVRFVNSGTEAVMTTIRVARAYTGRNKIIKFAGCYHGHADPVLVAAGSGPATLGSPDSAGVTKNTAAEIITVPFNDIDSYEQAMDTFGDEIAAVLVEPIVGNFGIVEPKPGFLEKVNEITHAAGALVIYDEVISAFRFHYGAAQDLIGVYPDLTALGKIIGGGLPIGAYGGRVDIMEEIAPMGPAYQAGTMAGNPVSMKAGIACLEVLEDACVYDKLEVLGQKLEEGLKTSAENAQVPVQINRKTGALTVYFTSQPVEDYDDADATNGAQFATFFHTLLNEGIHLAPSKFEAWFLTSAHSEKEISATLMAAEKAFQAVKNS